MKESTFHPWRALSVFEEGWLWKIVRLICLPHWLCSIASSRPPATGYSWRYTGVPQLYPVASILLLSRVNQQPPMYQLAVLSTGCLAFFHLAPDGVHRSPFLFAADHCTFFYFFFFLFLAVFPGPDLTHTYPVHFPTLISIAPTLVPYLLSPTDTATLITISYWPSYCTNHLPY